MKLCLIVPAVSLALCACGTHATSAQPNNVATQPVAVVSAPVEPPVKEVIKTLDHAHWSITVPDDWDVKQDNEDGMQAERHPRGAEAMASVQVITSDLSPDDNEERFAVEASILVEEKLPHGSAHISSTGHAMGTFQGHTASITELDLDNGYFIGALAVADVPNHKGYVVIAEAPMVKADAEEAQQIVNTFTLK